MGNLCSGGDVESLRKSDTKTEYKPLKRSKRDCCHGHKVSSDLKANKSSEEEEVPTDTDGASKVHQEPLSEYLEDAPESDPTAILSFSARGPTLESRLEVTRKVTDVVDRLTRPNSSINLGSDARRYLTGRGTMTNRSSSSSSWKHRSSGSKKRRRHRSSENPEAALMSSIRSDLRHSSVEENIPSMPQTQVDRNDNCSSQSDTPPHTTTHVADVFTEQPSAVPGCNSSDSSGDTPPTQLPLPKVDLQCTPLGHGAVPPNTPVPKSVPPPPNTPDPTNMSSRREFEDQFDKSNLPEPYPEPPPLPEDLKSTKHQTQNRSVSAVSDSSSGWSQADIESASTQHNLEAPKEDRARKEQRKIYVNMGSRFEYLDVQDAKEYAEHLTELLTGKLNDEDITFEDITISSKKRHGWIDFSNEEDAQKAIEVLKGMSVPANRYGAISHIRAEISDQGRKQSRSSPRRKRNRNRNRSSSERSRFTSQRSNSRQGSLNRQKSPTASNQ